MVGPIPPPLLHRPGLTLPPAPVLPIPYSLISPCGPSADPLASYFLVPGIHVTTPGVTFSPSPPFLLLNPRVQLIHVKVGWGGARVDIGLQTRSSNTSTRPYAVISRTLSLPHLPLAAHCAPDVHQISRHPGVPAGPFGVGTAAPVRPWLVAAD